MRHGIYRFRAASGATHYAQYDRGRMVEMWPGRDAKPQKRASVKKMDHDSIGSAQQEMERRRQERLIEALYGEGRLRHVRGEIVGRTS